MSFFIRCLFENKSENKSDFQNPNNNLKNRDEFLNYLLKETVKTILKIKEFIVLYFF